MLFLEPDVDYFRISLHQLALPEALLNGECVVPVDSRGADIPANEIQKETASSAFQDPLTLSLEEQAEVLHRALLASLHQRFPYEKHDTLENAYILSVTHLSSLMIAEVPLTCEELAAIQSRDSFLPPELQSRTFPSHLNELFTPQSGAGVVPTPNCGITTGGDERPQCPEKSETSATATHPYFYDSYFILLPELNTEEQRLYRKNHSDATRTRYRETDISGISSSTKNDSGATLWDSYVEGSCAKDSENIVKMGEGMVGLHVVDGNMIHFVSPSSEKRTNTALRSLQFSVFKIPLNRFTPDEQQYYTHKREETRFLGCDDLQKLSRKEKSGTDEYSSVYVNHTLKSMLASEMPERYRDEEQEAGKQFFSKCNTMLSSFVSSRHPRTSQSSSTRVNDDSKENQKQCFSVTTTTTSNAAERGSTNQPRNSACGVSTGSSLGVRRLVYSFAPCDCYHLVVDDNNPLYYAKSSRAAYNARTVTITLMSDMSLASVASPTISLPRHAGGTCVPESKSVDGLVSSNLPSRAGSPEPSSSSTSVRSRQEQQLQNQPPGRKDASVRREAVRRSSTSLSRRGRGASRGQSSFSVLSSKTDGFLRLTTSLCCNNVSGNPKHRKETLLEKGIHLPDYSPDDLGSSRNPGRSPENASAVANLFRLLSTSSVAQHQLRHGVIRPVVSVAVLDDSGASASFLSRESAPLACRGLLDHTWYSIKVQPLPKLQDDIQWMPIVFGSSECVSDVGYRTAMHMGFFPSGASNDKADSKKSGKSGYGVLPTVEDAKNSLAGAFEKKSSLAPLDPNTIQLRSEHSERPQMNALENPLKESSAGTSTRQEGVTMTFGNDDQPAGVSSRRGGVAMTFGNDDQPVGVAARRPTTMFGVRDVEAINKEETGVRQMNLDGGCFNDPNWFSSASCGSPKAQRPTVFDRFGGTVGESGFPPDNSVRGGSPNFSTSTRTFGVSNRVRSPGPVMEDKWETQMGGWRPPSPSPMFGERDRISGFRSDGRQPGIPRDDLSPPGMARMTAMNTFGSIKSQPTPRPVAPRTSANGQQQSPWVEKPMFYPPYNDRWQSNDCSRDQSRGGSFWRRSSYGVARFSHELPMAAHGRPDPLASPISSMSRSGLAMQDERMKPFWQNTGFGQRNPVSTSNNNWNFTEVPTHPANNAFQRKGGMYNQDYPRSTYINEYNDYPANGSRVRPRGTQAMDDMWSRPWIPRSSQNASDLRRPVPPPTYSASRRPITRVSRAPLSGSMPWRHTTTTSMGPSQRPAFPSTRPPLVPSGNRACQAFGSTGRGTATPSAARSGLSLRERVRLYQQQQRRETNLNAYHEDLHNNYCMGNDVKRFRYDTTWPGSAPPPGLSKSEDCMSSATHTTGVGKGNSAAIIRNRNLTRIEGIVPPQDEARPKIDKLSPDALRVYGEQAQGLRKLTETYDQADGINVSFCLRDLANAFLLMPCGPPREYDITKAPWIDDGVSYFVSTPPTRFRGGWESYLQHLNLYQQPFYLRDKAFIFVLHVPYHSHLRVCVAVHNLNDLMDVLRQRPLAQILPTKEQVWTQERMFAEESTNQQNLTETVEEVRFFGLIRRRRVTRDVDGSIKHKVDTEARKRRASHQQAYEQHQASGLRVTWRQRFTLLCLQASATLRGVVWRQCTTPLLTDPTVLQARMSYLSNRTAAYAALRQRLNTLKALSTSLSRQRVEETPWKQIRTIQDRIDSVGTMELGRDTEKTMPSTRNDFPPPSGASTPPPGSLAAAFAARRAAARRVTATAGTTTSTATGGGLAPSSGFSKAPATASSGVRRAPFRVNRIGDGLGTSARTLRQTPHESQGFGATAPPPTTTTTDSARVPPLRSTIVSYASSATLSRPPSPPPTGTAKATATMRMNGKVVGEEHDGQAIAAKDDTSGSDVLLRIAERLSARGDLEKEILTPPLTTVLKFTSSHVKEEKDHEQHSTQQKQSVCGTGSVLAGLLPAPTEIHRQHASFDITVAQMQQLLQWQWEHHQNSYEVVPLPVFRGALVTPTSTYFSGSYVELDGTRHPRQLGVSPLSRSLLLGLIKWGWLVPLDYEASRWDAQLRFTSDWSSLFSAQWSAISKWKLWAVLFLAVAWREQALGVALLYVVFRCFIIVAQSVFGVVAIRGCRVNRLSTAERRLPALDSGTSIVYRQSEAAVSAMLEDRQYFRSQLLATRILQAQHGVMNVWSRASLLISGHSPMLLFIIGCEFVLIGLLYLCYAFVATHTQFLTIILTSLWHLLETFFALLPGYYSDGLLQRWSAKLMLPSGLEDAKTLGFFLVLYVLCIFSSRSPLRYMFRVTWDLFLHDDALVRRPALSF